MGRYEELIEKRDAEGLSREEATELGRLMAERRGEVYEGNAADPPPDVEMRRESVPEDEIEEEVGEQPKPPLGPKGTEPRPTSREPETYPEGGQGPPPA